MPVLTRRHALSGGAALSASLLAVREGHAQETARPNIVWIVCHDIHAPLLGCYGNPLAQTPAIDALAAQGIRFDKAYATTPVCSPSRFSMMTGISPQSWAPAENMRAVAKVADHIQALPQYLRKSGYYCTNNVFTDYNCDLNPHAIWDECSVTAHWRKRPANTPFFSVYNYLITHESHLFETTALKTDPAQVDIPPYLPDTPDVRDALARNIDMVNAQDKAVAHILDELKQDNLAEETIVFFFADHGGVAPRTKRYCYEGGLNVPFITYFPRKYAHLAGRKQGTPSQDLVSLVDLAPTTLALAGLDAPSIMQGQPLFGRTPTTPRQYVFSGRNRMDECYDLMRTVTDGQYRYIRNYMPHRIYGQHNSYEWMGRGYQSWQEEWQAGRLNETQAAFWRTKPAEELYDLRTDPHQIHNLAQDQAFQTTRHALSAALDQHMLTTHDNAFVPETTARQGYFVSREEGVYPLQELLPLANAAITRNPGNIGHFTAALSHPNDAIRYWATTGLLLVQTSLPPSTLSRLKEHFSTEPSSSVRALLSEILLNARQGKDAFVWLAATIRNLSDSTSALAALTTATWAPQSQTVALKPAVEDAALQPVSPTTVEAVLMLFSVRSSARYLQTVLAGTYTPRTPAKKEDPAAMLHSTGGKLLLQAMGGIPGNPQI
ncbi:Choline-sulfatase [Acetobacter malorum]|uniref:Choline-sulfatase n=1 Tax=Acetobacter malorum TaxID=178901 RepID=A0A177G832_9PROT|nr:sulfatase [Acetobacter malorum]OAG75757.1 Choline-sulfatase [Acetobacter malorum]